MSDYCVGMKADRGGRTGGFKPQLQQTWESGFGRFRLYMSLKLTLTVRLLTGV